MTSPLVEWLSRIKQRPVLALPEEPEELPMLLSRIDTPDQAAAITSEQYFGLIERGILIVRLPLHAFTLKRSGADVRLLWIDFERRACRAMRLAAAEVEECARHFRPDELLARLGRFTSADRDGPLRLEDLEPGEVFRTPCGQLGQVAREQKEEQGGVVVWLRPRTVHTRKALWPGDTCVCRPAPEERRGDLKLLAISNHGESQTNM
jgi:hypothetical protein